MAVHSGARTPRSDTSCLSYRASRTGHHVPGLEPRRHRLSRILRPAIPTLPRSGSSPKRSGYCRRSEPAHLRPMIQPVPMSASEMPAKAAEWPRWALRRTSGSARAGGPAWRSLAVSSLSASERCCRKSGRPSPDPCRRPEAIPSYQKAAIRRPSGNFGPGWRTACHRVARNTIARIRPSIGPSPKRAASASATRCVASSRRAASRASISLRKGVP